MKEILSSSAVSQMANLGLDSRHDLIVKVAKIVKARDYWIFLVA